MMKINNNRAIFDAAAASYIREDFHWGSDLDLIMDSLDGLLKKGSHVKWLDIGCGPGFHIASIGKLYPEVEIVGIDYSQPMLKEAQAAALGIKNAVVRKADIIDDKIAGKYNLITFLNNGLGNLYRDETDPEFLRRNAIKKICRLLPKDGHFILSVYNREILSRIDISKNYYGRKIKLIPSMSDEKTGDLLAEYDAGTKKVPYYTHWFSDKELYDISKDGGFCCVDFLERRMSRFLVRYKKVR